MSRHALVPARPGPEGGGRDRWIDTLRALALGRVVVYHVVGGALLPVLFPSMGIMFALGGALIAASLDRAAPVHRHVLLKRLRRVLPPLWAYGAVVVPLMLVHGWSVDEVHYEGAPLTWSTVLLWVLPVSDPPGSAWGYDLVLPLWYIRTYLWFLVLSPPLLWAFRRWPMRTLAVPVGLLAAYALGVWSNAGRPSEALLSFATFGACWLLGFAHHDGTIRRLPWAVVLPVGTALLACGLAYALLRSSPGLEGWNIDDDDVADGVYCFGFALLLLRAHPDFSWMARHRVLDAVVAAVNARAMTIYLWGNLAIYAAGVATGLTDVTERISGTSAGLLQLLVVAWVLIGVAVLAVGWVEDVAGGRPPRLRPWTSRPTRARAAAGAPVGPLPASGLPR